MTALKNLAPLSLMDFRMTAVLLNLYNMDCSR